MTPTPAPTLGRGALRLAVTAWFLATGLTPASASPIESPEAATLHAAEEAFEDLEWLVGSWRGPGLGGLCEETWSRPQGGAMLGVFRLIRDGSPAVYEILTIAPDGEGGLEMRLKHFGADLTGWEERDEVVAFPFVSRSEGSLVFEGLAYHRDGDGLRTEVRLEKGEEPAVIRFTRVP